MKIILSVAAFVLFNATATLLCTQTVTLQNGSHLVSACISCGQPGTIGSGVPASFFNITVNKSTNSVWPGTNTKNGSTGFGDATAFTFNGVRTWNMTGGAGPNAACGAAAWDCIEYANGLYDWGAFDKGLGFASGAGQTDDLITLAATPTWANSCPSTGCNSCGLQQNKPGPAICYPPSDICTNPINGSCGTDSGNPNNAGSDLSLKTFVSAAIAHVVANGECSTGCTWEIWNEPDVIKEYRGTKAQLATMACDVYFLIKAQNAAWKVTAPAPAGGSTSYINGFLNASVPAGAGRGPASCNGTGCTGRQCVDSLSFHNYGTDSGPCNCYSPESAGTLLNSIEALGTGLPVVNTESSWGVGASIPGPTPTCGAGTIDPACERAAWWSRALIVQALGSGSSGTPAAKVFGYGWDLDSSMNLWDEQAGPPQVADVAGTAAIQTQSWLLGDKIGQQCRPLNGTSVWTCNITTPGGIIRQLVWDASMSGTGSLCFTKNNAANCKTYNVPSQYQSGGGNTNVCTLLGGTAHAVVSATGYQLGSEPVLFTPALDSKCG